MTLAVTHCPECCKITTLKMRATRFKATLLTITADISLILVVFKQSTKTYEMQAMQLLINRGLR